MSTDPIIVGRIPNEPSGELVVAIDQRSGKLYAAIYELDGCGEPIGDARPRLSVPLKKLPVVIRALQQGENEAHKRGYLSAPRGASS